MSKINLGLPLEYKKLPEYFDAHNVCDDTDSKNSVIEKLLKAHKVKTVLDLTCGTGSQVFFLAKHGYQVTGADFSPALLEIARGRASSEKIDVNFIDGDMRTLKVGTFDAVITIFNAIGHLTKAGFEKSIRNIHKNLKDGGLYVFDIFNLEAMTDEAVAGLAMHTHKKIGNTQIYAIQSSSIDRNNGLLTSYDSCMIQKNADKPQSFNNKFSLQIYTANELKQMLARNGFETVGQYGMDGSKFVEGKTLNIITVARKNLVG
ncbi:MAG: methyltransferase domain-containing protein [Alphaproteobacteria bacterium]